MNNWGEYVHVEAVLFKAGEHPWTPRDFYEHSVPRDEAPHTVDPIVQTIWEHDGPRVAESDEWWAEGYVWEVDDLLLGSDYRLTSDAWRFTFLPLTTGCYERKDYEMPRESLIAYEIDNMGITGTFVPHREDILTLVRLVAGGNNEVYLLTLWACEAGWTYVPGEPDDYDTNWQLIGAVIPRTTGVDVRIAETV